MPRTRKCLCMLKCSGKGGRGGGSNSHTVVAQQVLHHDQRLLLLWRELRLVPKRANLAIEIRNKFDKSTSKKTHLSMRENKIEPSKKK